MYQAFVRFRTKTQVLESSQIFNDYRSAQKYICEFPNIVFWSISPIKVLAPIAKEGQDFSVVLNVTDLNKKFNVVDDIGIEGIQDYISTLDLNNVSEIKIRLIRW